jgi:shikimate kinase
MMELMNTNGSTIYLKLTPEALLRRLITSRTDRPLIRGKSEAELLEFIKSLLEKREEFYLRARHVVDGMNMKAEDLAGLLQVT